VLRGLRPLSSFSSSQKSSAPQVRRGSRVTSEWPPPRLTRNRARSCYLPGGAETIARNPRLPPRRFLITCKAEHERERERERERDASLRVFRDILRTSVHAIHRRCQIRSRRCSLSEQQPSVKTINVTTPKLRRIDGVVRGRCSSRSSKSEATSRYAAGAGPRRARFRRRLPRND